jgi:hypothetical protein
LILISKLSRGESLSSPLSKILEFYGIQTLKYLLLLGWWNGRHWGLKIPCQQWRAGSTPVPSKLKTWLSQVFFCSEREPTVWLSSGVEVKWHTNLSFGFNSLKIKDLSATFPIFLLGNSAFGYSLRKKMGNLIGNLS